MAETPTFRAQLERLTAEQIHAGAPAIAIMLAYLEELRRVGIIAAAAHDMTNEDLRRARRKAKKAKVGK
jgi:hypothetical protein